MITPEYRHGRDGQGQEIDMLIDFRDLFSFGRFSTPVNRYRLMNATRIPSMMMATRPASASSCASA